MKLPPNIDLRNTAADNVLGLCSAKTKHFLVITYIKQLIFTSHIGQNRIVYNNISTVDVTHLRQCDALHCYIQGVWYATLEIGQLGYRFQGL